MECRRAADDYTRKTKKKVYIISDGGVQVPGDVVKAYVAGADYVMIGGLFAKAVGGSFSGSSVINDGHVYKTSEGKTVKLPQYTQEQKYANLKSLVESIVAGVNSAATYLGAESIEDFRKKGKFIRVTRQLNNMFN
jgi:GMP reductase